MKLFQSLESQWKMLTYISIYDMPQHSKCAGGSVSAQWVLDFEFQGEAVAVITHIHRF